MRNKEWEQRIKIVMDLFKNEHFHSCLKELDKLYEIVSEAVYENGSLTTWHEEEVLGLKSLVLERAGHLEEAIATRIGLGETHFERAKGHCENAGFSYAVAALLSFKLGDEDKACELAEKAVQLSGLVISMPSVVLEAASKLEEVRERKAREDHGLL
ncbi:MAG: hypothetical protein AAFW84_12285 [Cyanobacteria bacterium J06635_15]